MESVARLGVKHLAQELIEHWNFSQFGYFYRLLVFVLPEPVFFIC
jgi:hypothetical protein